MLKEILKRKSTWIVIVILLVVGGFAFAGRGGSAPVLTTEAVRTEELVQTVDATGTLRSSRETHLAFETSGIVGFVSVKVGDRVKAGALLASLRASDQYAESQEAAASVRVAEASASAARVSAENAVVSVENAKRSLVRTREESVQNTATARANLRAALVSGMIAVRKAVSDADEILGVDNTFANADYRNVLSAMDSGALNDAKNAYVSAKASLASAETPAFALSASSAPAAVDAAEALAGRALSDVSVLLLHVQRTLDATAIDTYTFNATELTALKASLNATRNSAQAAQSSLRSARQAVDAAVLAAAQAEDAAMSAVDSADASRKNADASAFIRAEETARAAASRASSNVRLAKTALRSPIGGVVTAVDVDPGELALSGTPVVTVQTVDGQFEVVAHIAEADVSKVSLGDVADVTFDAFGERMAFPARVISIDPAQKLVEGVVYYEAKLALDPIGKEISLKPGMTADATITTERASGVLSVPQRAVLLKDGGNVVRVQTGETTFEERAVTTGLRGDGGRVQILNGLSDGETIVVSVK